MAQTTMSFSREAKDDIATLRALVMSRKNLVTSRELFNEYSQLEGNKINYKKYGFPRFEEFLKASGQFTISTIQNDVYIAAMPNQASDHVRKMVALQKDNSKSRRKNSFPLAQLRAPKASDQSWNKSLFSMDVYPQMLVHSPMNYRAAARRFDKSNARTTFKKTSDGNNNNSSYINTQITISNNSYEKKDSVQATNKKLHQQQPVDDLRQKLNDKSYQKRNSIGARPILGQNNSNNSTKSSTMDQRQQTNNQKGKEHNNLLQKTPNDEMQDRKFNQTVDTNSKSSTKSSSIQNRLRVLPALYDLAMSGAETKSNNTVIENLSKPEELPEKGKIIPPIVFEFNPLLSPIISIAQYCTVRRYAPPEYKVLKPKFSTRFQCRVLINGIIYSTYPEEFATESESKMACAKVAVEQIKAEEARNRYPTCMYSDYEVALKLFEELKNHPHGMFCKNIPDTFQQTFKQSLPDHWLSILQSSPHLFSIETMIGENMIIYANTKTPESSSASTTSDGETIALNRLELPWEDKHWNLYISNPVLTTEIWGRIVSPEYSDKLDALLTDIELSMLTDKIRPSSIVPGQIYLVCLSECWHRIRVEDMDKSAGKCLCFSIDTGDEEWYDMDQLYMCEPTFLKLPGQAILFSLFGLEDFAENPNAKRHLDKMLASRILIAEILTKQNDYERDETELFDINAKIQIVLYDTTSDEDVNLNPLILQDICNDTPPPELKRTGVTNVIVTHISQNGDLFVQVKNMGLGYVKKLIHQLVESKFKEDQHKINHTDLKNSRELFLIHDFEENRWVRGCLVDSEISPTSVDFKMLYVDYGKTKLTNISNIFRLNSLSVALNKFPYQALKIRLHDVPPINEMITARLRGLLPLDGPVLVRIASPQTIPQVVVYRRLDESQCLINVNESIRLEYEIECGGDKSFAQKSGNSSPVLTSDERSLGIMSEISSGIRNFSMKSPLTLPPSPQRGELPRLLSNLFIPAKDEYFDVLVTMASNPGNFMVQPYNETPSFNQLMKELQDYCKNTDEFIPSDMIEVGQAYSALNSDGNYHRVTVEQIFSPTMIHVSFCDFGDVAVVSNDKLKTLPAKFRTLPKLAIGAKLHGIKPKYTDWTIEDCMRFRELTVGQKFVSIIKNILIDEDCPNTSLMELALIDVTTDEDIYIHEIFVKEERAVPI